MKKLKRNSLDRAFIHGYKYGITGKSFELCPFKNDIYRQSLKKTSWLRGWREGRRDNWSGYMGLAGMHKLSQLAFYSD